MMPYTLDITIRALPRMPNALLGARWPVRAGNAKIWHQKVWRHCWPLLPPEPLVKAKLTLTRCSSRAPDYDGLVGSFKAILDGLVKCGVIVDDTPEVIGVPTYLHELVSPKDGHVKIKVEEI